MERVGRESDFTIPSIALIDLKHNSNTSYPSFTPLPQLEHGHDDELKAAAAAGGALVACASKSSGG